MKILEKRRDGAAIWNRVHFKIQTDESVLKKLSKIQAELGYDPRGYDGPWNAKEEQVKDGFITSWTCSASCD